MSAAHAPSPAIPLLTRSVFTIRLHHVNAIIDCCALFSSAAPLTTSLMLCAQFVDAAIQLITRPPNMTQTPDIV